MSTHVPVLSAEALLAQIKTKTDNLDVPLSTRSSSSASATEATLAAIKAKTDNLDVLLSTRTKPADTQQIRALTSTDVVTAAQGAAAAASGAWPHKVTDGTNIQAVKAASTAAVATDPSAVVALSPNSPLPTGANTIGTVNPPALTKGTQGATGVSTQDLKDAGRTAFAATANAVAGVTTEAMLSMTPVRAGVAGSAGTSIAVTSGKRLRLTMMIVSFRTGAAAANWSRFLLRTNPAGAAVVTSPVLLVVELEPQAAVSGIGQSLSIPLPDGFEFAGTDQVGVSHIALATTNIESVTLIGFEY